MADVMTQEQRKRVMSRIKGRDTKPELMLRKALWAVGMRYRLHAKLPGRPDICFPGRKLAVFVDGCFWHGCPLHGNIPVTNKDFWSKKLTANVARDRKADHQLRSAGWTVLRFWEHEIEKNLEGCITSIQVFLENGSSPNTKPEIQITKPG